MRTHSLCLSPISGRCDDQDLEIAFDLGNSKPLCRCCIKLLPLRTVGGMLTCAATELDLPIMLVDDKQRITHRADTTETAMAASKLKARCPFYPNISALCEVGSTWDILPSREHFHMSVSPVEDFYLYLFDIAGPESQPVGDSPIVHSESQLPKKLLVNLLILLRFIALSYCWPGASTAPRHRRWFSACDIQCRNRGQHGIRNSALRSGLAAKAESLRSCVQQRRSVGNHAVFLQAFSSDIWICCPEPMAFWTRDR